MINPHHPNANKLINLDINSYDLDDILKLFNLNKNFDEKNLRKAKKVVLQTHPDKSGLDKEYFLFFSKAYKIIHSIHQFKNRSNACVSTTYSLEDIIDNEKEDLVKNLLSHKDFNSLFNELFEKNKLSNEHSSNGYAEWLKSDDGIDTRTATRANMNEKFNEKKNELRALVPKHEISETSYSEFGSDITGGEPEEFSSDIFSTLTYEDIRKAHTETVVPVTENDRRTVSFQSSEELHNYRSSQDITPLSLTQAQKLLGQQKDLQNQNNIQRAYTIIKQDEEVKKKNDNWLSSFKQLKY